MEFAVWEQVLLAVLVVTTITVFARALKPKIDVIRAGRSDRVRTDEVGRRLWVTFKEVLLQTRVIGGRPVAGALHAAVFGGFLFFGAETLEHFLKPFGGHFIPPFYKAVVAVAGLAEGVLDPANKVLCPGEYKMGRHTYRCWKRGGHGEVDLDQALLGSGAVYFYMLGV